MNSPLSAAATPGPVRSAGSTGWQLVGYTIALLLLYVVVADKTVVSAGGKLAGGAVTAAQAWITPTDPVALVAGKLGYTPSSTSPASRSSPSSATSAPASVAPQGPAPAPSKINLKQAKKRYGTVSQRMFEPLRLQHVKEGVETP